MRILVTGAAGFIGSTLSHRLLERGDEVLGRHLEPTPTDVADTMGPTVARVLDRLVASVAGAPAPEREITTELILPKGSV